MLKRFLSYMFDANVSNEDKATRLSMFWHFLGFYHHKSGGADVFGEGKASALDFLYKKRFGFNSAWNISGSILLEHKAREKKKKDIEELYNNQSLN
ncbi:MAG TPA: hypothetical protein PK431_10705 [Chitinophagales bacterium]|nr:hypothetical protein [Chitinophagales bacterium]